MADPPMLTTDQTIKFLAEKFDLRTLGHLQALDPTLKDRIHAALEGSIDEVIRWGRRRGLHLADGLRTSVEQTMDHFRNLVRLGVEGGFYSPERLAAVDAIVGGREEAADAWLRHRAEMEAMLDVTEWRDGKYSPKEPPAEAESPLLEFRSGRFVGGGVDGG